MGSIKVIVDDKTEKEFRKAAMQRFGYEKGALSAAANEAFRKWANERMEIFAKYGNPEDPIGDMRGILSNVKKTSVELQHEVGQIISENYFRKRKNVH